MQIYSYIRYKEVHYSSATIRYVNEHAKLTYRTKLPSQLALVSFTNFPVKIRWRNNMHYYSQNTINHPNPTIATLLRCASNSTRARLKSNTTVDPATRSACYIGHFSTSPGTRFLANTVRRHIIMKRNSHIFS